MIKYLFFLFVRNVIVTFAPVVDSSAYYVFLSMLIPATILVDYSSFWIGHKQKRVMTNEFHALMVIILGLYAIFFIDFAPLVYVIAIQNTFFFVLYVITHWE